MKITTIYFSATNTTKTIVTEITKQMSSDIQYQNLTSTPLLTDVYLAPSQLLIVGMPVYGGRIPSVAAASLKHLRGDHTPAILAAVYGNREYDDALVEMQDLLETNGFHIIAAGTFIAQHSIFPGTAQGRPDAADFEKINDFARRCKAIAEEEPRKHSTSITLPGNRPYKTPGKIPLKVTTGTSCTGCRACVQVCPAGAIPADNPHITDYEKCIHCGRCMYVCSEHARHYGGLLYHVAGAVFGWKNRKRKEPEFFF